MQQVTKEENVGDKVRQLANQCGVDNVCDDSDCKHFKSRWECLVNNNKLNCIYYSGKPPRYVASEHHGWNTI